MSATATRGLQSFLRMLETDPANASLRARCVSAAMEAGEYDVAQQVIATWLRRSPDDASAKFESASLHIAQRQYVQAIAILEALIEAGQRHPAVLQNLGLCRYCIAEYDKARTVLEEVYLDGNREPGLIRLLVSSLHHLSDMDAAVEIADANAEAANADGALAGVFALLYFDADRPIPAARWAKVALRMNPDSIDGLVVEGSLLIIQLRTADALKHFERALSIDANAGRAWLGLASLALLQRDLVAAKAHIERALSTLGEHVGTWHTYAWTQLVSGDHAGARISFERALQLNRNFSETHAGLAALAAIQSDHDAYQQSLARAEGLDPQSPAAKMARAMLAAANKDSHAADDLLAQIIAAVASTGNNALTRSLRSVGKH